MARDCALETLRNSARKNTNSEDDFKEDLMKVARTTISSKLLNHEKEYFAELTVNAILRIKSSKNLEQI